MVATQDPGPGVVGFSGSRRAILGSIVLLAASRGARAQQAGSGFRVGWLASTEPGFREVHAVAFVERLRELGLVEGDNLSFTRRHAEGRVERFPALAAELVELKSDVLFSGGPEAALAALKQASRDTPIVFVAVDFDPVTSGHVASLARPGGLVTGVTALQSELPGKRLELLRELLPQTRKVAVFANDQTNGQLAVAEKAAPRLGLALHVVRFGRPPFDYRAAFADAVAAGSRAVLVLGSGLFVPGRQEIAALAVRARLPSVFHHSQWTAAGGLMSYGFDFAAMWRIGAEMVARILRGGKAADIPMVQPSTYELAINLKTAKALGLQIPQAFRLRVDRFFD